MARRDFIINEKGELQGPLKCQGGDMLSFYASTCDVVLCFAPTDTVGAKRIEIASGDKVTVEVNQGISQDFPFTLYCCTDLTYKYGDPVVPGKGSSNTGNPVGDE